MKSMFGRIILVLIFLALLGNLAAFFLGGKGLASEQAMYWALAGCGILLGLFVNVSGIRYTTKAYHKRERSSLLWARRGFIVGLVLVFVIAADAVTSNPLFVGELWKAGTLLIALSAPSVFFLVAYYRDYLRTAARESKASRGI